MSNTFSGTGSGIKFQKQVSCQNGLETNSIDLVQQVA